MELAKMTKLTALIREKTLSTLIAKWKTFTDFLLETEWNEMIRGMKPKRGGRVIENKEFYSDNTRTIVNSIIMPNICHQ